ncbi:putative nucleotidyltransferase [Sporomusaceae bacterium BoRhaA]|uniref:nucleotidyltransferase family protein n=1 Tax=Pelorhabdus rhamnosifermentans TaxID=2772457 RepID=UPI001C060BC8|nr:nucleotidyltransferase family protein [Pelorhabdus rhamnosifermentans]MBU2702445.1 putative nucleotidyltransferase [Pelorhabdus rhamnosifermentans]
MSKVVDLNANRIKEILAQEKVALVGKYHISELGIFGSFVRGEQHTRSDVDILVDFNKTISAFQFIDLKCELSDKLGVKVDLVSKKALKPRIGKHILAEVEYI